MRMVVLGVLNAPDDLARFAVKDDIAYDAAESRFCNPDFLVVHLVSPLALFSICLHYRRSAHRCQGVWSPNLYTACVIGPRVPWWLELDL